MISRKAVNGIAMAGTTGEMVEDTNRWISIYCPATVSCTATDLNFAHHSHPLRGSVEGRMLK